MSRRALASLHYLHHGLPRQAPGSDASTWRAASLCSALPARPRALDIGCGPGCAALLLAERLAARVTAIDIHQPYLDELGAHAQARGLADRIEPRLLSMRKLDFAPRAFDLVWAEGSAYFLGIEESLRAWLPLLRPGGYAAFTELCWLNAPASRPPATTSYWARQYPLMRRADAHLAAATAAGYETVASFVLPAEDWWTEYLTPLESRIGLLTSESHRRKTLAAQIAESREAIELYRADPHSFGYVFFVVRRPSAPL